MKTISRRTWTGIMIVVAGFLFYGTWILWNTVVAARSVSIPVSLEKGSVRTPEFRARLNRYYIINIEAKKRLPLEILDCMMGISSGPLDPNNCKQGVEPLIQANWILSSDSQMVARGSSDDHKGQGGWAEHEVERCIGTFNAEAGRKYILDVSFAKDGRALAVTDPHLNVELTGSYYEDEIVVDYALSLLFFAIEAIGLILLAFSAIPYWRNRAPR